MNCKKFKLHLGTFVDGELDPSSQMEFERHLDVCAKCQEDLAFERSFRAQTRAALGDVSAPDHLWGRALRRLDQVDESRSDHSVVDVQPMKWRHAWPIAAAAAALLVIGTVVDLPRTSGFKGASMGLLQDAVAVHSQGLPADVTAERPQQVADYFQGKTPFPVRPAKFDQPSLRLMGARFIRIGALPAAALYYSLGGQRVTVLVFESPDDLMDGAQIVHVGGRELYYRDVGGYSVPVVRHGGLSYAFFGDLDRPALFRLAASAHVSY